MKKIALTFLIVLITELLCAQIITDGLVGYWPMNGNGKDLSEIGNNAIANNIQATEDLGLNENSALYFNGSNSNLNIPHHMNYEFGTGDFTISIMFKREARGVRHDILDKKLLNSNSISGDLAIYIPDETLKVYYNGLDFGSHPIELDRWYQVVFLRRDNELLLYVDNQLSASVTFTGAFTIDGPFTIGSNRRSSSDPYSAIAYPFQGALDEFYLFDRSLSDAELSKIFRVTNSGTSICENIYCDGENVGIGTSDTKGYKLAVAGNAIAEEVKVEKIDSWPDYVFKEGYSFLSLEEVEAYIENNGHLPEIPGEAEVKKEGINVGEMDAMLLKKIEELTLYLIEIKKELNHLEIENQELKRKVETLEQ